MIITVNLATKLIQYICSLWHFSDSKFNVGIMKLKVVIEKNTMTEKSKYGYTCVLGKLKIELKWKDNCFLNLPS